MIKNGEIALIVNTVEEARRRSATRIRSAARRCRQRVTLLHDARRRARGAAWACSSRGELRAYRVQELHAESRSQDRAR